MRVKAVGKVYVLNTMLVPVSFDRYSEVTIWMKRITVEEAKKVVGDAAEHGILVSAVGHESTARLLSQLLGVEIKPSRASVWMEPGDVGVHFFLKSRLPEGKVLTLEELKGLEYWLVLSEVVEAR